MLQVCLPARGAQAGLAARGAASDSAPTLWSVPVSVSEPAGVTREAAPASGGIPFKPGQVTDIAESALVDAEGRAGPGRRRKECAMVQAVVRGRPTRHMLAVACLLLLAANDRQAEVRADGAGPAALAVTRRVDLGEVPTAWWHSPRWNHAVIARDGVLLFFHATAGRTISCWLSADGRAFAPPVVVCRGAGDMGGADLAAAIDADDTIYVAYSTGEYRDKDLRVHVKRLPRRGPAAWDASAEATTPFVQFGRLAQRYPSLYVAPGSRRVWCLYSYALNLGTATEPLVTCSDDGGVTWAPPEFVGSNSGDSGTGVRAFRSWRGHPAFFWAFWDCAPPSWGFHDGSRLRPLRELFLHHKRRMACNHPWDALEGDRGRLYFVTGLTWALDGLVYRWFDGSEWSKEVFLSDRFGQPVLLTDGRRTFCAAAQGPTAKTPATHLALYELDGDQAWRLPVLYECPEGRAIARVFSTPPDRRAGEYIPLFILEAGTAEADQVPPAHLVYLRLEVKATSAGAAKPPLGQLLVKPEGYYAPMPLSESHRRSLLQDPKYQVYVEKHDRWFPDRRTEPRTDPPKDRRLFRIGDRWVLLYADDNPGRLLVAPVEEGHLRQPVAVIADRAWGRFQCSGAAGGDDRLDVVCGGVGQVIHASVSGIRDWGKAAPTPGPATILATGLTAEPWPTIGRAADGRLVVAYVDGSHLRTCISADEGKTWQEVKGLEAPAPDPRPALVMFEGEPVLLVGTRDGISCARWKGGAWSAIERVVDEKWIGAHFSAASGLGRLDLVYTAAASYLGRRAVLHTTLAGGGWSDPAVVDDGSTLCGLSLCALGRDRLLLAYAVQGGRDGRSETGDATDVMPRFTYELRYRIFDGRAWTPQPAKVAWPEVKDDIPRDWTEIGGRMGFVIVPAHTAGVFPTLPASSPEGVEAVPVAWMVPGFNSVPPYWKSPGRGGLLVSTAIRTPRGSTD